MAADALADDPAADPRDRDLAEARTALEIAQSVRARAMTDLRSLVDVLRADPVSTDLRARVVVLTT